MLRCCSVSLQACMLLMLSWMLLPNKTYCVQFWREQKCLTTLSRPCDSFESKNLVDSFNRGLLRHFCDTQINFIWITILALCAKDCGPHGQCLRRGMDGLEVRSPRVWPALRRARPMRKRIVRVPPRLQRTSLHPGRMSRKLLRSRRLRKHGWWQPSLWIRVSWWKKMKL